MNIKLPKILKGSLVFVLCVLFFTVLILYVRPMQDLSLDLSLGLADGASREEFDEKGWTVFTREDDTITYLTSNGIGGYTGIELGQTLYFSRVLEDDLDSPTLQLGTINRNFSVFLDGELIYTDCPEQDNRIGYLKLPMREWEVFDPLTISLPANCHGSTLTIAQSTPEYSERPGIAAVVAYPTDIRLYCGYAYESGLIAESYRTAFAAILLFAVGLLLVLSYLRNHDAGLLSIGLTAFAWMTYLLVGTSYFYRYYGDSPNQVTSLIRPFAAGTLLVFLWTRAGKGKQKLIFLPVLYALVFLLDVVIRASDISTSSLSSLASSLPEWAGFVGLVVLLVGGIAFWRKESHFYRLFTPLALTAILVWCLVLLFTDSQMGTRVTVSLKSGQISYIYYRILFPVLFASLVTALAEAIRAELDRRMEKKLMQQQYELVQTSYENLRRHNEEVMMLRHDMNNHFRVLHSMSTESPVKAYLQELLGQYDNIRPVVQSGNEMLDIILNSKLGTAMDMGIHIEMEKAKLPETLPLSDADLCSLVMNILDNAITAASGSGTTAPHIHLKIHIRSGFLALSCENSADIRQITQEQKEKTVPEHGLGLKIIRNITERYHGMLDTEYGEDYYSVLIAIPLDQSVM